MADRTKIEWTDASWQPVRGCSRISAGCDNCYAIRTTRRGNKTWGKGLTVYRGGRLDWAGQAVPQAQELHRPLHWRKPRRIFVCSQSDLFHQSVPDDHIAAVFGVMAACPQHTFQVLTKRPERARQWFKWLAGRHAGELLHCVRIAHDAVGDDPAGMHTMNATWPLRNVWLGTSVENQESAQERVNILLDCPAAIRWVSAEPLLARVNLSWGLKLGIHWVVVGGESGPGARPMEIAWARDLVRQCQESGTAVFVKQLGARPVVPGGEDVSTGGWDPYLREEEAPDGQDREVRLTNRKGGNPEEWPYDLRIRHYPANHGGDDGGKL